MTKLINNEVIPLDSFAVARKEHMERYDHTITVKQLLLSFNSKVKLVDLGADYQGLVAEISVDEQFDGTLIYFPGMNLKQLKGEA